MKRKLLIIALTSTISFANSQNATEKYNENSRMLCGGVERWNVKVLVDPSVATINFTPVVTTIANLVNIVTPVPNANMPRYAGVEDKTYSVTCKITIKKSEPDNDYHLVLSDGVNTLIGEVPDPACAAAGSSSYLNQYIAVRNFVNANIAAGNVYNVNIPPVVVYGVAFVDPPHGQTGKAPNNLELHPILDIHFASTPTGVKQDTRILSVNVSPNPTTDNLNIHINSKLDNLNNCEFKIFNAQGSLIKSIVLPKSNYSMDVSLPLDGICRGIYIYRITSDLYPLYEGKFIKE